LCSFWDVFFYLLNSWFGHKLQGFLLVVLLIFQTKKLYILYSKTTNLLFGRVEFFSNMFEPMFKFGFFFSPLFGFILLHPLCHNLVYRVLPGSLWVFGDFGIARLPLRAPSSGTRLKFWGMLLRGRPPSFWVGRGHIWSPGGGMAQMVLVVGVHGKQCGGMRTEGHPGAEARVHIH